MGLLVADFYGKGTNALATWWEGVSGAQGGRTLVVVDNVSQMVSTAVVRLPHTHGVVREVDIAIVTCVEGQSRIKRRGKPGQCMRRDIQKTAKRSA